MDYTRNIAFSSYTINTMEYIYVLAMEYTCFSNGIYKEYSLFKLHNKYNGIYMF
jgi:hypothetical protein